MSNGQFTAKWNMINPGHFTSEKEGYVMDVYTDRAFPAWVIKKDEVVIDHYMRHSLAKCELSARVQAERVLNKLLNQKINKSSSTTKIL